MNSSKAMVNESFNKTPKVETIMSHEDMKT